MNKVLQIVVTHKTTPFFTTTLSRAIIYWGKCCKRSYVQDLISLTYLLLNLKQILIDFFRLEFVLQLLNWRLNVLNLIGFYGSPDLLSFE